MNSSYSLWRMFKITVVAVLAFMLSAGNISAQTAKVTFSARNTSIENALGTLKSKYGFSFVMKTDGLDLSKKVTVSVTNETVEAAVAKIFAPIPVAVEVKSSVVYISAVPKTIRTSSARTVSGTVLDANNQPVIGAAILTGKSAGTTTDENGQFSLTLPGEDVSVEVSCLGYDTKNVIIRASESNVKIFLTDNSTMLTETVVVGYGSQKKVNLTGAISTVGSDDLKNRASLDVAHMLQGAVAGLNVTSATGRPGQAASFNIRGMGSINSSSVLVLVDGVEGNLQQVAPNDVESISVIKDASAAAIYGARAAYGVILVTTKSGAETDGKAVVRYSGRAGWTTPTASTDWEDRGYWSVLINNMFWKAYAGTPYATYTDEDMEQLWIRRNDKVENPARPWVVIDQRNGRDTYNYYANTDWWHYLYRDNKPTMSHNISFSGGTKRVKYFLSAAYNREQGMFRQDPDVYKKYTLRSKINFDVNKWIKLSNNTSYFNSSYKYSGISGANNSFSLSTVHALASYPVCNPDGSAIYTTQYNGYTVMDGYTTILNTGGHTNKDNVNNINTTTELTLTPVKQLEIKANYTYMFQYANNMNRSVNTTYSATPGVIQTLDNGNFANKLYESNGMTNYQAANLFATYSDSFNEVHNVKATVGVNWETRRAKTVSSTGYNLMSDVLNDLNLVGTADDGSGRKTDVGGGQNEYAIAGYFGRINYDYAGKYLFEVSGRYDGTSRFAHGYRWGFFPSGSLGWRISEENFFKPIKGWFNNLKLRYSYGQLGNQNVSSYYAYLRTITVGTQSYLFGGDKPTVSTISAPVADDLTWETSIQNNLGVDMALLGNRLQFTGDMYIRDTKNMLTAGIALPASYGASSPQINAADLRTKGYEFSIQWKDMFNLAGHPFSYNVGLQFSDYITTITKFDNPDKSLSMSYYEGMRYGEIWGYRVAGLFATDEEAANYDVNQTTVNGLINASAGSEKGLRAGDLKFIDLDGNKRITTGKNTVDDPGDREIIGNNQPRYNYGINLGFNWLGFDFSVFLQGIGRMDWYPSADARSFWGPYARPYMTYIPKGFMNDVWSEENPDAYFPRPRGYVAINSGRELSSVNDRYLQNIGYCRLKNLTFGYTLPQTLTQKINIDGIRVYFTGENLAYLSGLHSKYIDPEQAQTNGNLRIYPWQKTFMFGIDITF